MAPPLASEPIADDVGPCLGFGSRKIYSDVLTGVNTEPPTWLYSVIYGGVAKLVRQGDGTPLPRVRIPSPPPISKALSLK